MLKKNDKVKCISQKGRHCNYGSVRVGEIYTLYEDQDNSRFYPIINRDGDKLDNCYYTADFEIINDKDFKVGDEVICINDIDTDLKKNSIYIIDGFPYGNLVKVSGISGGWLKSRFELVDKHISNTLRSVVKSEDIKVELKNINKANLKEAKKQFLVEKTNAEIDFAKAEFRRATDKIDEYNRRIKDYEKNKEPHQEVIDSFNN